MCPCALVISGRARRCVASMAMSTPLFPLFLDLRDRPVLVVGGGAVALRKTLALLEAGARVWVGAPELHPELQRLATRGRFAWLRGRFVPAWLNGVWLVVAATDAPGVNHAVARAAEGRRIFVNAVDDIAHSSAQVPARIDRGLLQVAISTRGAAPMLARHLRERLEALFDGSLGPLTLLLSRWRTRIRTRLTDTVQRRHFFEALLSGPVPDLLRRGDEAGAERRLRQALESDRPEAGRGRVSLVGAGPGDAGLLTLRGLRVLNLADVVLHDHLVGAEVLAMARRDALLVDVGKRAGNHGRGQAAIHALMVEHARAGRHVVRLKGGDGFVFGRGGEELQALRAAGIDYEVVPGITAALACAAHAGIPLTHRDHAQAIHLATAHCRATEDRVDWAALARPGQTLAIYMGVSSLERIAARLTGHGLAPDTPAAIVERGSLPGQRVLRAPLAGLPALARDQAVASPALLIVGEVAALADSLHWFGEAPITSPAPAVRAA